MCTYTLFTVLRCFCFNSFLFVSHFLCTYEPSLSLSLPLSLFLSLFSSPPARWHSIICVSPEYPRVKPVLIVLVELTEKQREPYNLQLKVCFYISQKCIYCNSLSSTPPLPLSPSLLPSLFLPPSPSLSLSHPLSPTKILTHRTLKLMLTSITLSLSNMIHSVKTFSHSSC